MSLPSMAVVGGDRSVRDEVMKEWCFQLAVDESY